MKILIADSAPPCDLYQGNSLVGWHLFRRMRRHELVLICPAPRSRLEHYRRILAERFDRVYLVPRDRPVRMLTSLLEPVLARTGLWKGEGAAEAVRQYRQLIRQLLAAETFDVIHTRQLSTAAVTADLDHPSKLLELIDSETLQSARRARWRAPRTLVRAAAAAVLEGCAVRRFTACTAVSEADARTVRKLAPRVPVQVVPNGVDAEYFSPLAIKEDPGSLVFTGAMSFPPNVTAVLDFCRHTLPLIQQTMPGVRLTIVGRDPSPAVAALSANPAVTVTGFVEDIRPYLSRSNVTICPMSTGSGIKNKVLEALAMGRAVVTSRLGAEALEVTDGRHLRVADDPQSFAQAVVALLGDEAGRRRLGIAGRALVLRRYTWDACATTYERLYEDLIPGETGVRPMRRRQHAV